MRHRSAFEGAICNMKNNIGTPYATAVNRDNEMKTLYAGLGKQTLYETLVETSFGGDKHRGKQAGR
jgi:hypothetical protein